MKVAIPTRNNQVDEHFGHCEDFTIYTMDENKKIIDKESLSSPEGCGCKSDIASDLQQMGVTVMLAGNMGEGAFNVLTTHGLTVYRGCSGDIDHLIKLFLSGSITDSGGLCHTHGGGHECGHHH